MDAPTGVWLTRQLRRAEAHADNVAPHLEAAIAEVLADVGNAAAAAFTARATSLTAAAPGVTAASTMICLKPTPEQAAALALEGGEPAENLHVTLAYLGETTGPLYGLVDVLRPFALKYAGLSGVVGGIGTFADMGDGYPILALPDVPGLNELRAELVEELDEAGVDYARNHGFCPHVTLAYRPRQVRDSSRDEEADAAGAGGTTSAGSSGQRRLPDLSSDPLSGAARSGEGQRGDDPRSPDRLASQGRPDPGGDAPSSHMRERALSERGAHGGQGSAGARASAQPASRDLLGSRDSVRAEGQARLGEVQGVRTGSLPALPEEVLGLPLTFADLLIVRGDTEVIPLPLAGVPPLTAALEPAEGPPLFQWLTADAAPPFIPPGADEVIDVEALIARITARIRPVRDAAVRAALGGTLGVPMPLSEALEYYHSPKAFELNAALRSGAALTTEQAAVMKTLDAAFEPSPTTRTLYRGIPNAPEVFDDATLNKHGARWKTGGYLSTSASADAAEVFATGISGPGDRPILMSVQVPKGTPLLRIPAGDYGDQDEWLLPRQTQMMSTGVVPGPAGSGYERLGLMAEGHGVLTPTPFGSAVGISYDVTNPFVGRVLAQSGSQIVEIAHTTQLNVMRIIRASYREGLSIPHTAEAIREGMADASPARARLIARTELAGAVNGGSLAAVRIVEHALGVAYHKVWMTAPGAKHPRHYLYDGLNGQARKLADKFDVGGHDFDHPGDPEGNVGDVVNCRCAMRYDEGPPPLL